MALATLHALADCVLFALLIGGCVALIAQFAWAALVYPLGAVVVAAVVVALVAFWYWWPAAPRADDLETPDTPDTR